MQQRENERLLVDRWSSEKDGQLDSLRSHFLEREKLLLESARSAEVRANEAREHFARQQMEDISLRDRERREWDSARGDMQNQISLLMQEKASLMESANRKAAEAESAQRQLLLITEEHTRYKARLAEAASRMALVDSLQSRVHRLQEEVSQAADEREASQRHLHFDRKRREALLWD